MEMKNEVPGAVAGEMRRRANGRKARVTLTAEQWVEAERAYVVDGQTAGAVAARFGVAVQTIYQRFKRCGKRDAARAKKIAEHGVAMGVGDVREARKKLREVFGALASIAQGLMALAERMLQVSGVRGLEPTRLQDGMPAKRTHFAPIVWEAAKRDYVEGDFTAGMIEERYGIRESTLRRRASREGWDKTVTEAPPPLLPYPDPAQVEDDGSSAWPRVAHAAQLPPEGEWATWLFQGGRGAGKTRAGAEWLAARALATPNGRFALVAPTEHDLREVMIEGASGLRALPGREHPKYESTRKRLHWTNGAVAYGFSAEQPERLRGPQFMAAWADEFCVWRKPHEVLSNLRLGLRLGDDPRLVVTTTPKPTAALRRLREEASCVVTQAGTIANAANLTPRFVAGLEAIYGGTRLAEQELGGVMVESDGSVWTAADIAMAREGRGRPDKLDMVVVGVDPPAGGVDGSACGIVVAGRAHGRGYVLADRTVTGLSPLGWARRAGEAAREFGAVKIVAEANQGGDMVRSVFASAGVLHPVELARAVKSKRARAEPISTLYERGLVSHAPGLAALEEEMMALGADESEIGLDRADALVWALMALRLGAQARLPGIFGV